MTPRPSAVSLDARGRTLVLGGGQTVVMGVLNVTPDSFSDGGALPSPEAAAARARAMWHAGARIVDVGGESTRPRGATYGAGAAPVGLDEELARVVPAVEAVVRAVPQLLVSVDTRRGAVARAALAAGAHLVNDVSGLREGVGTARAAAEAGAPLVVMHAEGRIGGHAHTARETGGPADVVERVAVSLAASVARARAHGVADVIVDAGFGFGKTPAENLRLVAETDRLGARLGCPVLVGVSRKSTIGVVLGGDGAPRPVGERLFGSVGLACLAALRGAAIVRVHDVAETADALRLVEAAEAERATDAAAADAAAVAGEAVP